MKSAMPLILSSAFVAIVILAWTLIIALNVEFENAFAILTGDAKARIESLGQLGASYGILASIFAGLAVVLLRQSISIQHRELKEIRDQMLHDRKVTEFTWLLNAFESARTKASRTHIDIASLAMTTFRNLPTEKEVVSGHKLIHERASEFLLKRKQGDYHPDNDIEAFRKQHQVETEDEEVAKWEPLMPFYLSARQVAKYLFNSSDDMRENLYPLFSSVTTVFDMIFIHESILISDDAEFKRFAECTGLFSEYGEILMQELKGGPRINDSAFSLNSDK